MNYKSQLEYTLSCNFVTPEIEINYFKEKKRKHSKIQDYVIIEFHQYREKSNITGELKKYLQRTI